MDMNEDSIYESIAWHSAIDERTTEPIYSRNKMYGGFRASMNGSSWKEEPQRFEIDWLSEINALSKEWENRTYVTSPRSEFMHCERGKARLIRGSRMRDRVVRHVICDYELGPSLAQYLIHNNGASQKGKGISFSRTMFENDLHNYWIEHGNNDGYVGFVDMSKFYDNIQHDKVREAIFPKISEPSAWLLDLILDSFKVDVSHLSDDEYAVCMETKYDSIDYHFNVPKELKTGEKWMRKSVDIGDQVSQDIGVFFPAPIDNYAKIVRGCKRYGRYMDDIYVIGETREEVRDIIRGITVKADELGLFINEKKTHISKLSGKYRFLQIQYSLQNDGRVMKKINPKSVTRERRKLKAYRRLLDRGEMTPEGIEDSFKSWLASMYKYMSNQQIFNMLNLYLSLYGGLPKWKKHSKLRWATEQCLKTSSSTETTTSQKKRSRKKSSMRRHFEKSLSLTEQCQRSKKISS